MDRKMQATYNKYTHLKGEDRIARTQGHRRVPGLDRVIPESTPNFSLQEDYPFLAKELPSFFKETCKTWNIARESINFC